MALVVATDECSGMIKAKLQFYCEADGGGDYDYFRFSLRLLLSFGVFWGDPAPCP
jgi:hypothetical protein